MKLISYERMKNTSHHPLIKLRIRHWFVVRDYYYDSGSIFYKIKDKREMPLDVAENLDLYDFIEKCVKNMVNIYLLEEGVKYGLV